MQRVLARIRRRDAIGLAVVAGLLLPLALPWSARPAWGQADATEAAAAVQNLAAQIWQTLGTTSLEQPARLDAIARLMENATDVELLSRLVLARHWQQLDDEQKVRYQALFRDVVMHNFAIRLNDFAKDSRGPIEDHFAIVSSAPAGKQDVLVRSRVRPHTGKPLAVDWRLREGDGGPVIIDVIIEGVSLLVSQRSEFAAVIERSDMEGLLAELQARASASKPS